MSADDSKQVQDALQAIKKLVEMSEEQMSASDDVVMLDNVVWRNPVSDESEETEEPDNITAAISQIPSEAEESHHPEAPSSAPVRDAAVSINPRDLDELVRKPAATKSAVIEAKEPKIAPPTTSPLPQAQQPSKPLVPVMEEEITELTSPLGRRGGGFYGALDEKDIPAALRRRPAIQTSAEEIAPRTEPPAIMTNASEPASGEQAPKMAIKTSLLPVEPAITDFHGADFNFSAAEGLMTAASFRDLASQQPSPITPEVNVPVAQPAVRDPASEAQKMFDAMPLSEEEPAYHSPSYPNLHIVSDQDAIDDEEEEEGFSGAVRMALRSIIKEQVSTWLQGNMTGLIEEALTTPQKRPSSGAKSGKKKR